MIKRFVLIIAAIVLAGPTVFAQQNDEIEFGRYGDYSLTLDIGLGDLDFGPVTRGSDQAPAVYEIDLQDALAIEILGVPFLDVHVDIIVENDGYLLLGSADNTQYIGDPERSIPFELEAAYSNAGEENHSPGHAQLIPVSNNIASVRFPVLQRQFQPPGPPPAPPTGDSAQSAPEDIALVWIYGTVQVGDVVAGDYRGRVRLEVSYE